MKKDTRRHQNGLTIIELIVVLAIMAILFTLATVNITPLIPKAQVSTTVDQIIADLKSQQTNVMSGRTIGASGPVVQGIYFESDKYILFTDTYQASNAANFTVLLPDTTQISTTFPNNQIIFSLGSGEIVGATGSASIAVQDETTGEQKSIELNKFGVVTEVE